MIFFRREFLSSLLLSAFSSLPLPSFSGKEGHFAPPSSPPPEGGELFFFTARNNPTITPFETLSLVNVFSSS